jgi:hypothetical protein
MPNPPICNKNNMTICPNLEKSAPVSLTISPVTQVALVAVKNASTPPIETPSEALCGSHNKAVPIRIVIRKLSTTI